MHGREYLTVLSKKRSVTALLCCILTLSLAFYGVISGVNRSITNFNENGFFSFIYFTMISNTLAALAMAFVFPFTVEGIRKKRFILPKWAALLHYTAATSIAYVMIFVFMFISWASPEDAFGGSNIVTHIFCPVLILVSFFQTESGHLFTWKDRLLGIIPLSVYIVVYYIEVALIGEENGGWPDIYRVQTYLSPAVAIPMAILLGFGVSTAVALLSNYLTKKRKKKMYMFWSRDLDPVEVRIEAFGIGRMAGSCSEKNSVQIPYDIISFLAERYGLQTEELMKPFLKGLVTELNDRKDRFK